jgi:hypothetical protein
MILSHKYKFIFFCNPKTGSTSIEKTLEVFQEGEAFNLGLRQVYNHKTVKILFANKHIPPLMLKAWLPKQTWDSYFKFVFVRNPWDWFVSEWKYHFSPRKITMYDLLQNPKSTLRYFKNYNHRKSLYEKNIFTVEDVDYLFNRLKEFHCVLPDASGLYQSNYVFDVNGKPIVDFIARFESLENDFNTIKQQLNINVKLPHLNSTQRSDYKNYFTEESKQRVGELWKRDIEAFGYTFD